MRVEQPIVKINITHIGAVVVEHACLWRGSVDSGVCAIYLTTDCKRPSLLCTGSNGSIPTVTLEAGEGTLYVDPTKLHGDSTEVEFPEFAGWSVFAVQTGKYQTAVCLTKDDKD